MNPPYPPGTMRAKCYELWLRADHSRSDLDLAQDIAPAVGCTLATARTWVNLFKKLPPEAQP
jgi:hypothetical protein